jgi:hypothetical protein
MTFPAKKEAGVYVAFTGDIKNGEKHTRGSRNTRGQFSTYSGQLKPVAALVSEWLRLKNTLFKMEDK